MSASNLVSAQSCIVELTSAEIIFCSPAGRSENSYIKDEPYVQPFFTDVAFAQLHTTTTEPHPSTYLATRPSHSSSGDVSPFSPFSFSASWAETQSIYPQPHLAEPISFAFNTSTMNSPRTFSANVPMHGWMQSGTDVPALTASAITSPSSSCAPTMAPAPFNRTTGGPPYPLPFVGQPDKYGDLDLERPLEEQQLGVELSLKTKQHYLEAYWTHVDPIYPILHKGTYRHRSNPLLTAAMMATGAQYTYEPFAHSDSRILHGKCLELISKYKNLLATGTRQDYMQAIFLVEVFTQFKAKRSPQRLSDVFLSMYATLWKIHANTGRSYIDSLTALQPQLNDPKLRSQWMEWANTMASARLLAACFIFESVQSLSLARPLHSTPASGLDLLVPMSAQLWDAMDHHSWWHAAQTTSLETLDVAEALEKIASGTPSVVPPEAFQSMLLVACYAASVLYQKQQLQTAPFSTASSIHPAFEAENISMIERTLSSHSYVSMVYSLVQLVSRTPIRAILATSGESWILCQRLSQEALLAAAEFTTLKTEMRTWTETAESSFFHGPAGDNVRIAVQHALTILRLGCDIPPASLAFGPDMALYYACLVLWAVTFGASSKASATGMEIKHEDASQFDALAAQRAVKAFCDFADTELSRSLMDGIIPSDRIHEWSSSMETVLRWAAWTLGGHDVANSTLGELLQNAVGVLGRLANRGFEGDWF